jgi:predicted MFS family arabinose efflux permease
VFSWSTDLGAVPRSRRLWLLLAGTVFVTGGYMATFSYISRLAWRDRPGPGRVVMAAVGIIALLALAVFWATAPAYVPEPGRGSVRQRAGATEAS